MGRGRRDLRGRIGSAQAWPALPLAWMVVSFEAVGGLLTASGLLIRPIALIAFWVVWLNGFAWNRGGWEYPAMWAAAMLAIALRGEGPWSLDRPVRVVVPFTPGGTTDILARALGAEL